MSEMAAQRLVVSLPRVLARERSTAGSADPSRLPCLFSQPLLVVFFLVSLRFSFPAGFLLVDLEASTS